MLLTYRCWSGLCGLVHHLYEKPYCGYALDLPGAFVPVDAIIYGAQNFLQVFQESCQFWFVILEFGVVQTRAFFPEFQAPMDKSEKIEEVLVKKVGVELGGVFLEFEKMTTNGKHISGYRQGSVKAFFDAG